MNITGLRYLIGQQIGLAADFDGSIDAYRNLTPAQQIAVTQGVIAYIRSHPGEFTAAQVETANVESGRAQNMTPEDTSFDFGLFFNELETEALNAGNALANVGTGITQSVSLIGTLLPAAVIIAILVFAYPYIKRAAAA